MQRSQNRRERGEGIEEKPGKERGGIRISLLVKVAWRRKGKGSCGYHCAGVGWGLKRGLRVTVMSRASMSAAADADVSAPLEGGAGRGREMRIRVRRGPPSPPRASLGLGAGATGFGAGRKRVERKGGWGLWRSRG